MKNGRCGEGYAYLYQRADLSDPVNQAIALTVVDDGGLKALKSRSESDTIALAV